MRDADCAGALVCDPGARVCDVPGGDAASVLDAGPAGSDAGGMDSGPAGSDAGGTDSGTDAAAGFDATMPTDGGTGGAICGNGIAESGEQCDADDLAGFDCTTVWAGYAGGTLACTPGCMFDVLGCTLPGPCPACGNGVIDPGEDCEGGDLGGATCTSQGHDGGTLACSACCGFVDVACSDCGDGLVESPEICESGNLSGETCASRGYDAGALQCAADCLAFDESLCTTCGNGLAEPGEECDGSDLGGATCATLGYSGGALACTGACNWDTAGCSGPPASPAPRKPMNGEFLGSIFVVGGLQPTFTWDSTAAAGTSYELQYTEDPSFTVGVTEVATSATSYQPPADLPAATAPPVGARYWWRVRACEGAACSAWSAVWYFNLGRSLADFNGDGYADVLIAHWASPFSWSGGGPGSTFGSTAGGIYDPACPRGKAIASLGDVNGDGFADLAAGCRAGLVGDYLYTRLYLGGSTWDATPDGIFGAPSGTFMMLGPINPSRAGDVNGDGYDDLLLGGEVYLGGPGTTFDTAPDGAAAPGPGYSGVSAGDVNGDGYSDVLVLGGTIYFGAPGSTYVPAAVASSIVGGAIGDINADGFADVLGTSAGSLHVYYGESSTIVGPPDVVVSGISGELATGSDVNGDGYGDFVVGDLAAPCTQDPVLCASWLTGGAAWVYLGGSSFDSVADLYLQIVPARTFGAAVGMPGDVNGDGIGDWAVGSGNLGESSGRLRVYFGADTLDDVADYSYDASPCYAYHVVQGGLPDGGCHD